MKPACWWLKLLVRLKTESLWSIHLPSDQVTCEFQCDCIRKTQFRSISNPIYVFNIYFFKVSLLSTVSPQWVAEASCGRKQLISYFLSHQHLHSLNLVGSPLFFFLNFDSVCCEPAWKISISCMKLHCAHPVNLKEGSEVGSEGNPFSLPEVKDRVSEPLWPAPMSSVNFLRLYMHIKCMLCLSRTTRYPYSLIQHMPALSRGERGQARVWLQ